MKIAILQPTYFPWCGYFDLIDQVDTFVILDNVQFEKRSWQHRNRIKTPTGLQWLTVPVLVHGRFQQKINEVEICEPAFARKHVRSIACNYSGALYVKKHLGAISELLECDPGARLSDLNLRIIEWLCSAMQVRRNFVSASALQATGRRTELLANICVELGATEYLSPLGSAEYLLAEMQAMALRGVDVTFQHYEHPVYRQQHPPFVPYASALDLLLNEGPNALEIIRSGRRPAYQPSEVMLPQVAEA
ncbi:MAG TPA: WbqC family protein [Terriglobales bacterium]|nr:WbqC family protein [Terriglobales bacterium]